jgi:hypothetical protein
MDDKRKIILIVTFKQKKISFLSANLTKNWEEYQLHPSQFFSSFNYG